MSYNRGQGQFGSHGNLWAMIRQLLDAQGSINPSMQSGAGALQEVKATYDFSVDGGAVGAITLKASPLIPANAIIFGGAIYPITTPTSAGAATIAVGLGTGAQAAALKAAANDETYAAGTALAIIPVFTIASAVKVTAESKVTITVATAALNAGKFSVHLFYFMPGE